MYWFSYSGSGGVFVLNYSYLYLSVGSPSLGSQNSSIQDGFRAFRGSTSIQDSSSASEYSYSPSSPLCTFTVLLYYCITVLFFYCITVLLYYCITVLLYYYSVTVSLYYCVITLLLYHCITVLLYYYSVTVSLYYCIIVLLYYCITVLLYHCITQLLFALASYSGSLVSGRSCGY